MEKPTDAEEFLELLRKFGASDSDIAEHRAEVEKLIEQMRGNKGTD
jgi:hypothetical protein